MARLTTRDETTATPVNDDQVHIVLNTGGSWRIKISNFFKNILQKDNTTAYTPTSDYHPATKKYVDDNAGANELIDRTNDSYVGARKDIADQGFHGFEVRRNKNDVIGYIARNESTGNAAYTAFVAKNGSVLYQDELAAIKFSVSYNQFGRTELADAGYLGNRSGNFVISQTETSGKPIIIKHIGDFTSPGLDVEHLIMDYDDGVISPDQTNAKIDANEYCLVTRKWIDDNVSSPSSSETADTGTSIDLGNSLGNYCNMGAANTNTTFSTTGSTTGGWAIVRINSATEPTVTGGTKIKGSDFTALTDMYMTVRYTGERVEFFFAEI